MKNTTTENTVFVKSTGFTSLYYCEVKNKNNKQLEATPYVRFSLKY